MVWRARQRRVRAGEDDALPAPDLLHRILEVNAAASRPLPQRADRSGRAGGDDLRLLGGALADGRVPGLLARLHRARAARPEVRGVPVIVFTKGGGCGSRTSAATGCDAVGVDWTVNLGRARQRIGARCALQGKPRPMVLMASPQQVQAEPVRVLESFGAAARRLRPRLQPRPRHLPSTRPRRGVSRPGRGRSIGTARRCGRQQASDVLTLGAREQRAPRRGAQMLGFQAARPLTYAHRGIGRRARFEAPRRILGMRLSL